MEYKVIIDSFEGPLDLLLHLVKKSNINICDINIVEITNSYLDFINQMEKMNLDIASEYLIMAAELIEIKSNILLPKPESNDVEDERQELINKLLNYEQYKNVLNSFRTLEVDRRDTFTKQPDDLKKYGISSEVILNNDIDISCLLNAFNKFLEKKNREKPLNTKVTTKEYSVSERCNEIKNILTYKKKLCFDNLFDDYDRGFIIVTFLAILNLVRMNSIIVFQDDNFNKIYIEDVE